jgi:glycosyltransferase involved in cell wall biosynthesis
MTAADAVHIRCPGSFGLIGAALGRFFSPYRIAKYAGQWNGYPGEPGTVRLQRRLLRSRWWGAPVTVYGRWPGQEPHVISFFTSVLTDEQVSRARLAAGRKKFGTPLRVLFAGRLSAAKNVDVLIRAIAQLRAEGVELECTVVGDGNQRANLEQLVRELGVQSHVRLAGGMDTGRVLDYYEESDVLVLASETEGWPKAIAEAMAFGLVCVGSDRGLVPEMLGEGRGFVVRPRDLEGLVDVLRGIAANPAALPEMSARAAEWGQRCSLEGLREALRALLARWWNVPMDRIPQPAGVRSEEVRP